MATGRGLVGEYRGRVKELETALCELRTRFCVLLLQRDQSYPERIKAALDQERRLHLLHREEGREQWIGWLKKHREYVQYELTEGRKMFRVVWTLLFCYNWQSEWIPS
ncbi:MAG: hypothetical protein U1F27_03035 [Turneriella sp.]